MILQSLVRSYLQYEDEPNDVAGEGVSFCNLDCSLYSWLSGLALGLMK